MHDSIWDPEVYTHLPAQKVLTGSQMGFQVGQAEG